MAWRVPPSHLLQRRDGEPGAIVFDPADGRSWRVGEATAHLLDALRSGWAPPLAPPRALADAIRSASPDAVDDAALLDSAMAELAAHGLVEPAGADGAPVTGPLGWHDLRLRLAVVAAPPVRWRPAVRRAALAGTALALVAVAAAVRALVAGRAPGSAIALPSFGWSLASLLLFAAVHELGHAIALAAATGAPVPVGVRLRWGLPQAYADVARVVTLPARRDRLVVLAGGVAIELLLWALLAAALATIGADAPRLLRAAVLVGGPGSAALSLLPFFRSDGYFLLQELAALDHLADAGRAAVRALLLGVDDDRGARWWLPWYGLLDLALLPALLALAVALVGVQLEAPAPAAALAAAIAASLLARRWSRLRGALPSTVPAPAGELA